MFNNEENQYMPYITINADKKLSAIKEEFNQLFPFLKLEFFKHKHKVHAPNAKADLLVIDATLLQLHKKAADHSLRITEDMPVALLEQLFQEEFGIAAQVFRKSGKSWLETSVTDDWTLKRQNDEGRELSIFNR